MNKKRAGPIAPGLSVPQAAVFLERVCYQLSFVQIGKRHGFSAETARTHFRRARAKLSQRCTESAYLIEGHSPVEPITPETPPGWIG